ncbi:hypothetical protein HOC13_01380 [Candidatus Woesearchaeota archaeon]|mgnify:CR=1 FL=1|jgi:hypothetical protein|nr:hypothetical protein [Candidatus Woesearchaeota archaeon]
MNVERIQKINDLALELMKQGLTPDREAAIEQAEKLLSKQDYTSLKETNHDIHTSSQNQEKQQELTDEKIKDILEKNTLFMVKTIKEFRERLEGMDKKIQELKIIRAAPRPQPTPQPVQSNQQAAPVPQPTPPPSAENHPRSGNFNDTDVSIEKFFYAGTKPRD